MSQSDNTQETLQIAQDVARRQMEARSERSQELPLKPVQSSFGYTLLMSG